MLVCAGSSGNVTPEFLYLLQESNTKIALSMGRYVLCAGIYTPFVLIESGHNLHILAIEDSGEYISVSVDGTF